MVAQFRNPLSGWSSYLRNSCVLACVPASGSIRDWSRTAATTTVVGTPVWERDGDVSALFCTGTGYVSIADNVAQQGQAWTLFTGFGRPYTTNDATERSTMSKRSGANAVYNVKYTNVGINLYVGGVNSGLITTGFFGTRSMAHTFTGVNDKPISYANGVYLGTHGTNVTATASLATPVLIGSYFSVSPFVPLTCALQFNQVLDTRWIAWLHQWSMELRSPVRQWPGYGQGFVQRDSLVIAPPRSNRTEGAELLVDGDMEAAGTAAWTSYNAAVLAKSTDTPYEGARCLRVTYNGTNNPSAGQIILTVGKHYRVRAHGRGDGGFSPRIVCNTQQWLGTVAATWQYADFVFNPASAIITFGANCTAAGLADWDACSVVETNELLSDSDMEATYTSMWSALSSAVITKSTTSPHSGLQCLRIAYGGVANPIARQTGVTVIGMRYRFRGWARGDGAAVPRIADGGAATLWTGTASTAWQYFDVTYTAQATEVRFYAVTAIAGYSEFDEVSLVPVRECVAAWDFGVRNGDTIPDLSGHGVSMTCVGNVQPRFGRAGKAVQFDSTSSYAWYNGTIPTSFAGNHTIEMVMRTGADVATAQAVIAYSNTANDRFSLFLSASAFRFGNYDGATYRSVSRSGILPNKYYHIICTWEDGPQTPYMWVNSVTPDAAGNPTNVASTNLVIGARSDKASNFFFGSVVWCRVYSTNKDSTFMQQSYDAFARLVTLDSAPDTWRVSLAQEGGAIGARLSNTPWKFCDTAARCSVVDSTQSGRAILSNTQGMIFVEDDSIYGTWDFEYQKVTGAVYPAFMIGMVLPAYYNVAGQFGYMLQLSGLDNSIRFYRVTNGALTTLFTSPAAYVDATANYTYKIARRRVDGRFSVYIKGGAYTNWRLVDVATGSNPIADTNNTTGKYTVAFLAGSGILGNLTRHLGELLP